MITITPPTTTTTTTGFSLSPGGLLLPYHLGVLESLKNNGALTTNTPIAGSSAGSIAVACTACELDSKKVLDATIDISDQCKEMGGARGRLLPLLREKMNNMILDEDFNKLQQRTGETVIAYKEIFPNNQSIFQKTFNNRIDLFTAVCHSSMFPFFATNWPVALDMSNNRIIPRLLVDGYFTVPRERFGCPDFTLANINVERTISICVFPNEITGIINNENCICPEYNGPEQSTRLFQLATESSSRETLTEVYESGLSDGERWCREYN